MKQILFENVTKEYEVGIHALNSVSFEIDSGEFVFVVGPSGAGKSTIVKLLIREELPDSGKIMFNDVNVAEIAGAQLSHHRRKIGVIFQDFKLLQSKNVYENVSVSMEVVGAPESEIKNVVPNVLSLVGLADKVFKFPKHLSGGEKQRLCIARALAHEPEVLVADEATGMIDPDSADSVIEILQKINELGTTIIMATHDERIVNKLKKRVIRFENGKLVSDKVGGKYRD